VQDGSGQASAPGLASPSGARGGAVVAPD